MTGTEIPAPNHYFEEYPSKVYEQKLEKGEHIALILVGTNDDFITGFVFETNMNAHQFGNMKIFHESDTLTAPAGAGIFSLFGSFDKYIESLGCYVRSLDDSMEENEEGELSKIAITGIDLRLVKSEKCKAELERAITNVLGFSTDKFKFVEQGSSGAIKIETHAKGVSKKGIERLSGKLRRILETLIKEDPNWTDDIKDAYVKTQKKIKMKLRGDHHKKRESKLEKKRDTMHTMGNLFSMSALKLGDHLSGQLEDDEEL